jgi:hypothetical protein
MAVLLANSLALSMQSSCSELERVQFGAEESVQQVVAMQGKGYVCVCVCVAIVVAMQGKGGVCGHLWCRLSFGQNVNFCG